MEVDTMRGGKHLVQQLTAACVLHCSLHPSAPRSHIAASRQRFGLRFSLLLFFFLGTFFGIAALLSAQQPSQRSRPNVSVRSNRLSLPPMRVAQLPNAGSSAQNPPQTPQNPLESAGQDIPELPPRADSNGQPGEASTADGPQQFRVPLQEPDFQNMRIKSEDGLVSLVARNAALRDVLTLLAETQGLNVVTADPLSQPISVTLERVQLNDALDAVLSIAGYTFSIHRNIILVSSLNNAGTILAPQAQGLRLEVFQLDYAMAQDLNTAITGMLSPLGQSYIVSSSETENRRPRELVAVNDLPQFLDRIRQYVAQVDIPPRQVMIEAHILQVDLDDENRHGVNFDQLFRRNGNMLFEMHTAGLASATPGQQAFTFRFSDGNLASFLEMLRTQTDAKTLASPRILVLNGQQARLQVGQQLGFRVTTTTETSTTESVDFLDVGVVLEVTPRISRDGKVMMSVRPEVSSGQVNPSTGLPEEETTELETDILLCDHEGIMIGGLIQETDDDLQSKIPWLGDVKLIGKLFQRRATTKQRREIIITLIPRLLPYESQYGELASEMYERADTPLLQGPLVRVPRPWEPRLSDCIDNPVVVRLPRVHFAGLAPTVIHCPQCEELIPAGNSCPACQQLPPPTMQMNPPPAETADPSVLQYPPVDVPAVKVSRLPATGQGAIGSR